MKKINKGILSFFVLSGLLVTPTVSSTSSYKNEIKNLLMAKPALTITVGCLVGLGLLYYKIKSNLAWVKDPHARSNYFGDWQRAQSGSQEDVRSEKEKEAYETLGINEEASGFEILGLSSSASSS